MVNNRPESDTLLYSEVLKRIVEELRLQYYRLEPYLFAINMDMDSLDKEELDSYKELTKEMEVMRQLAVAVLNVPITLDGKGIHISSDQYENEDDKYLYNGYTDLTLEWANPYEKHSNY